MDIALGTGAGENKDDGAMVTALEELIVWWGNWTSNLILIKCYHEA